VVPGDKATGQENNQHIFNFLVFIDILIIQQAAYISSTLLPVKNMIYGGYREGTDFTINT
jgi:hypothetical protein